MRTFCAARDEDVDGLQELLAVGVALVSGSTWALDILDGRIQAIRPVISPGKPGHAGPVADARTVPREANRARRLTAGAGPLNRPGVPAD
ncbi:MAG TPA: hypothetical protein VFQ68_10060 [Streptosporangiaceae bacterium]|nr:hypothetical protein [Streptosporangiaceae bacterium]